MSASAELSVVPARPLRVLLLAFEFPPLASGGVHRALGFARALPSCGVELDVVTVREADYPAWTSAPIDPALTARVPPGVRVHRIASGFPDWYWRLTATRAGLRVAQFLYWGDPVAVFWRRPLMALLDRLVPERRPDVLLATAPPFGVAVLARAIAHRYRLPWVADFRDAWTRWCVGPYPSIAHYRYARRAERGALRSANYAVATSHVTRDDWMRDIPDLEPGRLSTIYNGYDCDGPPTARAKPARTEPSSGSTPAKRDIVYAGSFYYTPETRKATYTPAWRRWPHQWLHYRLRREDWLYRSPYFFLRGLARLRQRQPEIADRLRVIFAGPVPPWLPAMLADTGTASAVALPGVLPHADVLRLQRSAAAALLTSAKVTEGRDYSIAGKTYEYFGARVPILALLTDGAMSDVVKRSGLGLFADPDDPDAVADVLARIATAPDPRRLVAPDETFIRQFARPVLAVQMAACLRRAAAEGPRACR